LKFQSLGQSAVRRRPDLKGNFPEAGAKIKKHRPVRPAFFPADLASLRPALAEVSLRLRPDPYE
jgi:hypothetical protein